MAFPPKQDHRISLAAAAALTKAHRANAAQDEVKGEMWPRDVFETLLAQPGCAGIRIYHGRGPKGEKQLVMVSVCLALISRPDALMVGLRTGGSL